MEAKWTLQDLVAEVAARIAALPAPRNGQVRAVPDDRTVRYYGTIGLLDRPSAMRGRTALYGEKHVAQVVAIKRLQAMGRSLSEIQALWPTLDDQTLARMSGVAFAPAPRAPFWKQPPAVQPVQAPINEEPMLDLRAVNPGTSSFETPVLGIVRPAAPIAASGPTAAVELRVELAPNVVLTLAVIDDQVAVSPADIRAIRAAAAPLLSELASRRLAPPTQGEEGEE